MGSCLLASTFQVRVAGPVNDDGVMFAAVAGRICGQPAVGLHSAIVFHFFTFTSALYHRHGIRYMDVQSTGTIHFVLVYHSIRISLVSSAYLSFPAVGCNISCLRHTRTQRALPATRHGSPILLAYNVRTPSGTDDGAALR